MRQKLRQRNEESDKYNQFKSTSTSITFVCKNICLYPALQNESIFNINKKQNVLQKKSIIILPYSILAIGLLTFFACFSLTNAQENRQRCSSAPTPELWNLCRQMRRMDRDARLRASSQQQSQQVSRNSVVEINPPAPPPSALMLQPIPVAANSRGQFATHPYDCMTLQCLCPFFRGQMANDGTCYLQSGQPLTMSYRKEYRMLSENERQRFHYALTVLKQNGEYDRLSSEHRIVGAGSGAHSGPGFLPWHREYLKRVEIALRLIDPTIAMPYWDSVMDGYLPDPRDSILHSPMFIGETDMNGFVVTGPFAFWRTLEGRSTILRALALEGHLFTEAELNSVMMQTNIEYILAYTVPTAGCPFPLNFQALEYTHSNIHLWLGGDMKPPVTSANDPIFYLHHSFVDLIWESWRQMRQPRWVREYAYSPDLPACANPLHFSYAQMRPFNLINRDGLSNSYTDQMYRYAPRPVCNQQTNDCGSPYLFCDTSHGFPHCVAKIKPGGWCAGFQNIQNACYNGQCYFGRCYQNRMRASFTRHFNTNGTMKTISLSKLEKATTLFIPYADCYNRDPCCEKWAKNGECKNNKQYMNEYCQAACNICTPSFNTTNECTNRHKTCGTWHKNGECTIGKGIRFMQENCRQSCDLCNILKCGSTPELQVLPIKMLQLTEPPKKLSKKLNKSFNQSKKKTFDSAIETSFRRVV